MEKPGYGEIERAQLREAWLIDWLMDLTERWALSKRELEASEATVRHLRMVLTEEEGKVYQLQRERQGRGRRRKGGKS